jgi:hypothetical protein
MHSTCCASMVCVVIVTVYSGSEHSIIVYVYVEGILLIKAPIKYVPLLLVTSVYLTH